MAWKAGQRSSGIIHRHVGNTHRSFNSENICKHEQEFIRLHIPNALLLRECVHQFCSNFNLCISTTTELAQNSEYWESNVRIILYYLPMTMEIDRNCLMIFIMSLFENANLHNNITTASLIYVLSKFSPLDNLHRLGLFIPRFVCLYHKNLCTDDPPRFSFIYLSRCQHLSICFVLPPVQRVLNRHVSHHRHHQCHFHFHSKLWHPSSHSSVHLRKVLCST